MVESLADQIIGIAEGLRYKALNHGNSVNSEVVAAQAQEIIDRATTVKAEASEWEFKVDLDTPAVLTLDSNAPDLTGTDGRNSASEGEGSTDGGPTGSDGPGSTKKGRGRSRG